MESTTQKPCTIGFFQMQVYTWTGSEFKFSERRSKSLWCNSVSFDGYYHSKLKWVKLVWKIQATNTQNPGVIWILLPHNAPLSVVETSNPGPSVQNSIILKKSWSKFKVEQQSTRNRHIDEDFIIVKNLAVQILSRLDQVTWSLVFVWKSAPEFYRGLWFMQREKILHCRWLNASQILFWNFCFSDKLDTILHSRLTSVLIWAIQ